MNTKKFLGTAAVLAVLVGVVASVYPQRNAVAKESKKNTPIGSWKIVVVSDSGPEQLTFVNFAAFTSDGQVINSNHAGLAAIGGWTRIRGHRYAVTFTGFGELNEAMMLYKIRSTLELADDGERLSGPFVTQFYDMSSGNYLFEINGTVEATRLPITSSDKLNRQG